VSFPVTARSEWIGLRTPADVHFGLATDNADRRTVLTQARARHPHRFGTGGTPKILDLPDTAWINRPAQNTTQETALSRWVSVGDRERSVG
jgi:putative transposase